MPSAINWSERGQGEPRILNLPFSTERHPWGQDGGEAPLQSTQLPCLICLQGPTCQMGVGLGTDPLRKSTGRARPFPAPASHAHRSAETTMYIESQGGDTSPGLKARSWKGARAGHGAT